MTKLTQYWKYHDDDRTTWKYSDYVLKRNHETGEDIVVWKLNPRFIYKDKDPYNVCRCLAHNCQAR